jgi:5'-nucleotidase (lipoprotein e(P4) family)
MIRLVLRAASASAFALATHASMAAAQPEAAPRPSLVVLIAVDQFPMSYFERFGPELTGGLGRLYRAGAVMINAHHEHAMTETAPGHASMMSGRYPRSTGIIANVFGVADPASPLLGGNGEASSPYRFRGSTLYDWIRARDPRARALSVSRKARSAILPVGRAPAEVFWYGSDGRFTTSTWYSDTLPAWVNDFNRRRIPQSYVGSTWRLLKPAAAYPERDSVVYEHAGKDFVFPHILSADTAVALREMHYVPAMDSMTVHLALAGLSATGVGLGEQADFLSISLSTTDAIGHRYGPDSRELHDQVLRVDQHVGVFLDSLFKLRDSTRVAIVMTSDHGITPFPEPRVELATKVVNLTPIITEAAASLPRSGDTASIAVARGLVTLDRNALSAAGINVDSVVRAVATKIRAVPGVLRADILADLGRADTTSDMIARQWVRAVPADFPGVIGVTFTAGTYVRNSRRTLSAEAIAEAQHGTPHASDTHVPVIFYGSGFVRGKHPRRTFVVDIAPTVASLLGVVPFERLDGRVIPEVLRAAPRPSANQEQTLPNDVRWVRSSAEYQGLTRQVYKQAAAQLQRLSAGMARRSWAVILDADETVLDNSEYQRRLAITGASYHDSTWALWVREKSATPVPGAAAFTQRVRSLGGRVVIVTNRADSLCAETRQNLDSAGIGHDLVLCKPPGGSNKNPRFRSVQQGTAAPGMPPLKVVAWVGDNILDFPELSQAVGRNEQQLAEFGARFFLLPNPMYGSWAIP